MKQLDDSSKQQAESTKQMLISQEKTAEQLKKVCQSMNRPIPHRYSFPFRTRYHDERKPQKYFRNGDKNHISRSSRYHDNDRYGKINKTRILLYVLLH